MPDLHSPFADYEETIARFEVTSIEDDAPDILVDGVTLLVDNDWTPGQDEHGEESTFIGSDAEGLAPEYQGVSSKSWDKLPDLSCDVKCHCICHKSAKSGEKPYILPDMPTSRFNLSDGSEPIDIERDCIRHALESISLSATGRLDSYAHGSEHKSHAHKHDRAASKLVYDLKKANSKLRTQSILTFASNMGGLESITLSKYTGGDRWDPCESTWHVPPLSSSETEGVLSAWDRYASKAFT